MDQLIQILFEVLQSTVIGPYLMLIALVALLITHLVPQLPPAVTEKIPNWIMVVLNAIAGQYKHAENMQTDIKGNRR